MISPTGRGVRTKDNWGEGRYGASRGNRKHKGVDYICKPGQKVVSPINGIIIREAKPYAKSKYSGLLIAGEHIAIKMFYFEPLKIPGHEIMGKEIKKGDTIGIAQDISEKYPGMDPHIHLEIVSVDPAIFTEYL